jgi:ankyrin repeat protein
MLISANADVDLQDKYGKSPLHSASLAGHLPVMQTLISAKANLNLQDNKGRTPLFSATLHSRTSAVRILLANGALAHLKPHSPPFTPLQVACFTGCFDLVKVILLHFAEQNLDVAESLPASCASLAAHCIARLPTCVEGDEGIELKASQ